MVIDEEVKKRGSFGILLCCFYQDVIQRLSLTCYYFLTINM